MKYTRYLVFGLIACAFTALAWAEEEATEPEWDATSRKLLDDWETKTYHLGRAGVEKASCTIEVSLQGQMTGTMGMKGAYKWDGEKGSLTWDNTQLAAMLQGQGFGEDMLDEHFKEDANLDMFGKCKLTAESADDGTKVNIEGENKAHLTALYFDGNGKLTKADAKADPGMGQELPMTIAFEYGEVDGKLCQKTFTVEMEIPNMGKVVDKTEITTEKVGDYWVTTKQHSTSSMGGQQVGTRTITIKDWKFNDDVE